MSVFSQIMQLPELATPKRFSLNLPPGSADAALLASLVERERTSGRTIAVFTADASDAQRLLDELPFFSPEAKCVLFPDWETSVSYTHLTLPTKA